MTEDDTFKKLRQTPIGEMMELIATSMEDSEFFALLNNHGWEEDEFTTACLDFALREMQHFSQMIEIRN